MIQYSIGELVDKLCIVNLKIWHTEEDISLFTKAGAEAKEIEKLCDRVVSFNKLRNKLIESINEFFEGKEWTKLKD
jgi:hypothetical protein